MVVSQTVRHDGNDVNSIRPGQIHRRVHRAVVDALEPRRRNGGFEETLTVLSEPSIDPAHDNLLLAQLSDVHVGFNTPERRIRDAVAAVNAQQPDIVFLTGDYVTYSAVVVPDIPRLLGGLAAPTFVVLGNHDHIVAPQAIRQSFERVGYTVLQNAHRTIDVRGAPLTVFGVDDRRTHHDDVEATFAGAPTSGTRLVLAHIPSSADDLPADQGLVCFSGHTHGGQITLPGGMTDAILHRLGWPYLRGHYRVRGNQLYVNRGLGFGRNLSFTSRQARPEVAFFRLRRGHPGDERHAVVLGPEP